MGLKIDSVSIRRGEVRVFQDLSLSLAPGETLTVLGPSGCGKSSLLSAIAGTLEPDSGSIRWKGEALKAADGRTALVQQDFALFPWMRAEENAALGLKIRRFSRGEIRRRLNDLLPRLGIDDLRDRYPAQLSGGEQQRFAIARALALDPELLLMDEPFSALDAMRRESLQAWLLSILSGRGIGLLLVTHSIEEAAFLGNRICVFGEKPISAPLALIDNPGQGSEGFRLSEEYFRVCRRIRLALKQAGALT